jgi:signal transduction histidine kinase/PAS domain-containing protein
VGVFVASAERVVASINARLATMLAAPRTTVGVDFASFLDEADRDRAIDEWQRAVARRRPLTLDVRLARSDGRPVHAHIEVAPRERDWIGTVTDVTARHDALVGTLMQTPAAIAITRGPDFVYELSNAMNQRLLGGREVIGKSVREAFPELADQGLYAVLERVYRTGEPYLAHEVEAQVVGDDGQLRSAFLAGTYTPLRDASGRVEAVMGFAYEVTEQVEARRASQRFAERQRFLAEAGRALASSLDHRLTVEQAVRLSVPLLADFCFVDAVYAEDDVRRIAAACPDDAPPDLIERVRSFVVSTAVGAQCPAATALRRGRTVFVPAVAEYEEGTLDGEESFVRDTSVGSIICAPLVARGHSHGVITFARRKDRPRYTEADVELAEDLAARVAMQVDNAKLYAAAEAASRAKDEFLALVSHELRTPLSSILGWSSLLRRDDANDASTLAKGLEVIERNARSQMRLIEDILDLSRIVRGEMRLLLQPIDVATLAREVVDTVAAAAAAKAIALVLSGADGEHRLVGDPDRVRQVMWNLLANAVKFTPNGGRVELAVETSQREVGIVVRDTGRGMEPSFVPHAFDAFRQGDARATGASGGVGLGLAIVRHIVEAHGGSVRAESEGAGKGATFHVTLPVTAATRRADDTGRHVAIQEVDPPRKRRLSGTRVLVVEDDPDGRDLVELALMREGAAVKTAGNARAALDEIEGASFDVVLSDIGLPERDGYWLATEIKRVRPQLAVIALTAFGRPEDVTRALDAGFAAHLTKPVDPLELIDAISRSAARA